MADITVSVSSPGLVFWGSELNNVGWGEQSWSGQELSSEFSVGTTTTAIDVAASVTGTQLASAINSVTEDISQDQPVTGTQINLTAGNAVASIQETVTNSFVKTKRFNSNGISSINPISLNHHFIGNFPFYII